MFGGPHVTYSALAHRQEGSIVRQHLLDLFEIQKIDLSIREQERERDELPSGLRQAEGKLAALETEERKLTEERATAEREARALSALLDEDREKIRKWESRLGDLRNQREYQALHRETEGQRRAMRDNEEKLSTSYRLQELLDEQLASLSGRIEEARSICQGHQKEVGGQLEALDTRLHQDQARRDALVPSIPKSLFRKYDTIRARRAGIGLSTVRNGSCISCHMRLPPQLYNVLQRAESVEQCPSCFRLILWEAWLPVQPEAERTQAAEPLRAVPSKATKPSKAAAKPSKAANKASKAAKAATLLPTA